MQLFKDRRYFDEITKSDELTQKWNDLSHNGTTWKLIQRPFQQLPIL
jgi:hypothetical protein